MTTIAGSNLLVEARWMRWMPCKNDRQKSMDKYRRRFKGDKGFDYAAALYEKRNFNLPRSHNVSHLSALRVNLSSCSLQHDE